MNLSMLKKTFKYFFTCISCNAVMGLKTATCRPGYGYASFDELLQAVNTRLAQKWLTFLGVSHFWAIQVLMQQIKDIVGLK